MMIIMKKYLFVNVTVACLCKYYTYAHISSVRCVKYINLSKWSAAIKSRLGKLGNVLVDKSLRKKSP